MVESYSLEYPTILFAKQHTSIGDSRNIHSEPDIGMSPNMVVYAISGSSVLHDDIANDQAKDIWNGVTLLLAVAVYTVTGFQYILASQPFCLSCVAYVDQE
jgi:hypothetical protein